MMGWVALAVLTAAAFLLLRRLGVARELASFAGAALMLGAAGYSLQGRPDLPGVRVRTAETARPVDPGLIELRGAIFGRFNRAEMYHVAADALTRAGNQRAALSLYLGAVNADPQDAALWTALGGAYADHDAGAVSPAARFAFDQAIRLAPDHPGPPFFLGLAYVRAGEFRAAQRWWQRAYALSPPAVSYRAQIGERLALLDAFLASPAGQTAR